MCLTGLEVVRLRPERGRTMKIYKATLESRTSSAKTGKPWIKHVFVAAGNIRGAKSKAAATDGYGYKVLKVERP